MALHVVLYQPEIPANTGNIARTCAATDATLHLIRPLGFSTDDKMLKRAGLDYWEFVNVVYHDSLDELFDAHPEGRFFFITKFGQKPHTSFDYSDQNEDYFFVFGRETNGLPKEPDRTKHGSLSAPADDRARQITELIKHCGNPRV